MPPPSTQADERNYAIKLDSVRKSFGSGSDCTVALAEVSFEASLGELTLLAGPSGCGKTTLLSIIAGTLRPDSGSVNVLGQMLHSSSPADLTRFRARNVGFIFQQFNLIPTLTATENVSVPLIINGVSSDIAEERAVALLDRVGLRNRAAEFPAKLSGGQQQRIAIARALIHDPRILICDEPTSALDRETGREVMAIIREMACVANRCVVVVSHDSRIYCFADRMAEMEDGQITRVLDSPSAIASLHSSN